MGRWLGEVREYDSGATMKDAHRHVVIDVETTGLSAGYGDRVIEVGAVAVDGGEIVAEYGSLIRVEKSIPSHVSRIHGITNDMLADEPLPDEVYPALRAFLGGSVLVAHNARFDLAFLRFEYCRLGLRFENRSVCTLDIARRRLPLLPDHRLETVYRHLFGALPEGMRRHRALDDARLTSRVWCELRE